MAVRSIFNLLPSNKENPLLPMHAYQNPVSFQRPHQAAPESPDIRTLSQMTSVQIPHSDALITISRQEAHLQSTLQLLLDAQSEGLLAGITGGPPYKETSSTGSRTPTIASSSLGESMKPSSIVPVRQPTKKKPGLKGARRGITRAISDLARLKIEESRILGAELLQRAEALNNVHRFESKKTGLMERIYNIESEDTNRQVEDLKREEKALDHEIRELETRLWEMKAKHRHLLQDIETLDNSVQSKLSSYKSALTLVEKESRRFLEKPPTREYRTASNTGLWALPIERRTLEMAREQYVEEQELLQKRLDDVETERGALEDGVGVWDEVIEDVHGVEKLLREEMQELQMPLVQGKPNNNAIRGMSKVLEQMSTARSRIESKLEVSEARDWKLLVCCIGAELEAMIEGQTVLQGALETARGSEGEEHRDEEDHASVVHAKSDSPVNLSARLEALGKQDSSVVPRGNFDRSEDEDDGPGPDLLISHTVDTQ